MKPRRVLLIAALTMLAATACQTGNSGSPASPTPAGASASSSATAPTPTGSESFGSTSPTGSTDGPAVSASPGGGPAVPAGQVDASAMTSGAPQQVWTQSDGRIVALMVEQAGCQQVSAKTAKQTPTEVDVDVITTTMRARGQMCPMIVREVVVAVRLDAPLGNRTLVLRPVAVHNG